jgi:hypothetical protein
MRPPGVMITYKLVSYGAAKREVMPGIVRSPLLGRRLETAAYLARYWKFESIPLQRRVTCEPDIYILMNSVNDSFAVPTERLCLPLKAASGAKLSTASSFVYSKACVGSCR